MPFTSEEFKNKMHALEEKHREWFSKHPPIGSNNVNSIHDHYYIYASTSGYQLRFNAGSDLPVELRAEVKDLFDQFKDKV